MAKIKKHDQLTEEMNFLEVPPQEYNISEGSSSRNGKGQINLYETYCSLNSSAQIGSDNKNRRHPFKKIKEAYLIQKNNEGKVIKKMIQSSRTSPKNRVVSRLDDAMTIFSQDSPKSTKTAKFIMDESVIILSGENVQPQVQSFQEKASKVPSKIFFSKELQDVPLMNKPFKQKKISIFPVKDHPALGIITEVGFLVNVQKLQHISKFYQFYKNIEIENVLKIYNIYDMQKINLKNKSLWKKDAQKLSMAFYQPYTQTLLESLLSAESVKYERFLSWVSQIIQTLSKLFKMRIFPQIDKYSIVFVNTILKFRLNPDQTFQKDITKIQTEHLERLVLKSLGNHLKKCIEAIAGSSGSHLKDKLRGINIFSRQELRQLLEEMIWEQTLTIAKTKKKIKLMMSNF